MKNKAALALAVGAAFTTPALAQTTGSTLEIYGRVYPAFASYKASGATTGLPPSNLVATTGAGPNDQAQRYSVDAYNSRLGFRGREALGGGMSAIYQMEQRVQIDQGNADFFANRDSFLGLTGGFGTFRMGRMDTIHNDYGNVTNFFGIKSGHFLSSTSLITDSGLGGGGQGFDARRSNSLKYETPEFGGFQVGFSYSPDEQKGNPTRSGLNSDLWAAAVKWSSGPFYVSAQYERHNDDFDASITSGNAAVQNGAVVSGAFVPAAGASSENTSMRLSARWSITSNHRIAGDVGQLEYKESGPLGAGRFESRKHMVYQIGWEASWGGPWRTALSVAQATDGDCSLSGGVACSTSGLKSSEFAAGIAYDFSKRTFLYAGFAQLNNGDSALYDNQTNGGPPRGSDVQQWGIGVAHSF
jgi:predicted porin